MNVHWKVIRLLEEFCSTFPEGTRITELRWGLLSKASIKVYVNGMQIIL
jgi:hypothetical protein